MDNINLAFVQNDKYDNFISIIKQCKDYNDILICLRAIEIEGIFIFILFYISYIFR